MVTATADNHHVGCRMSEDFNETTCDEYFRGRCQLTDNRCSQRDGNCCRGCDCQELEEADREVRG